MKNNSPHISPMKIAFVADGRAEHTRRWVGHFGTTGDETLLLSTYPCEPIENVETKVLPGLFRPGNAFIKSSGTVESYDSESRTKKSDSQLGKMLIKYGLDSFIRPLWHRLSTSDVIWQARAANRYLKTFQPDIVHALRIPNETFVLGSIQYGPKLASVWGQDFIYNCKHYAIHRWCTKRALPKLDAITADCQRDLRLAKEFGFNGSLCRYFPGNGGVDTKLFSMGQPHSERQPVLVYARGFGPYLRPDVLFASVVKLVGSFPNLLLRIIAPSSQIAFMQTRMEHFQISPKNYSIEPFQSQQQWAQTLQSATAYVSPSISDGTPNGMLEAMSCGAIPVMGDIESIREWVIAGQTGFLFDPESTDALTPCLEACLTDAGFRQTAANANRSTIQERCARDTAMPNIRRFYEEVIEHYRIKNEN